jgi:DNA-binding transcriptional regulator YiaG
MLPHRNKPLYTDYVAIIRTFPYPVSQQDIARKAGVSVQSVRLWMKTNPTLIRVAGQRLAKGKPATSLYAVSESNN